MPVANHVAKKVVRPTATFPLHLPRPRGKPIPLTISWYRNAHYRTLSTVKNRYNDEYAAPQLKNIAPVVKPVYCLFVLYTANRVRRDLDNFTGVHKKFFMDCLVKNNVIVEDHVFEAPLSMEVFGGVDKENPRVDIYVSSDLNSLGRLARKHLWLDQP